MVEQMGPANRRAFSLGIFRVGRMKPAAQR